MAVQVTALKKKRTYWEFNEDLDKSVPMIEDVPQSISTYDRCTRWNLSEMGDLEIFTSQGEKVALWKAGTFDRVDLITDDDDFDEGFDDD